MSQLLSRLEAQLSRATDPTTRAELTARISCLHSRVGRFTVAQQLITGLRREFGDAHSPRASVWIMLAEGLNLYFERQYTQALDRLTRAQFLGVSMRYASFVAITSAWKAVAEYNESRYETMTASLKMALDNVEPDDLDTLSRICLTVAIGFRSLGDRDQARLWFSRGHYYAVRNGDQAAIEALLHNSAMGAVYFLSIARTADETHAEFAQRARFELESARNLNTLTQSQSTCYDLQSQDARLKLVEGRYADAITAMDLALQEAVATAGPPHIAALESCYCRHMLGDATAADAFFAALPESQRADLKMDDRMLMVWMARELAAALGRSAEAADHALRLAQLHEEHRVEMQRLAAALREVTSHWTPSIPLQAQDNIGDYCY